jgi:hypothetical protein
MIRRIVFGVVWCVVIYFAACVVTGGIAGGIAGGQNPENAAAAGAQAGSQAVEALRGYLFLGAALLAILGTWTSFLPGTHVEQ